MKILSEKNSDVQRVEMLAERTGCEPESEAEKISDGELHLYLGDEGLMLRQGQLSVMGDFTELLPRVLKGRLDSEMLVKVSKLKKESVSGIPVLFDATAGMGEDSFILAAAGFKVILYEYNVIIASLLEDALLRALKNPGTAHIVSRMELHIGDSIEAMKELSGRADVILLDPMFPERTKKAMVGKKFQLLQQLESPCSEQVEMINAALLAAPRKIVIKRPAKGPYLGGVKPDYSLDGKAVRYDCIVNTESRLKTMRNNGSNAE